MNTLLKERLKQGKACIGGWLTVNSSTIVEAMVTLGFDWVAIDMEHAPISETAAVEAFAIAEKYGCTALVRMPSADPYLARRLLDAGAAGVIVPVVESAADFAAFSRHCLFPPEGFRGSSLGRFNCWGDNFEEYNVSFKPIIVPQIETPAGVKAASEIAAMAEVDALFLGPYDLSARLGTPGNFFTPEFVAALETVKLACNENGIAAGIHQVDPDAAELARRIEEGFSFVAYGTDIIAIRSALKLPENLK